MQFLISGRTTPRSTRTTSTSSRHLVVYVSRDAHGLGRDCTQDIALGGDPDHLLARDLGKGGVVLTLCRAPVGNGAPPRHRRPGYLAAARVVSGQPTSLRSLVSVSNSR